MSYLRIGFIVNSIIATAAILKVSPQKMVVSPEHITTDIGAESVTFTCTVELDPVSATSEQWIRWSHGVRLLTAANTEFDNNDRVLYKDKYSLQGMSSTANNITQSVTIHGIEEDDNGLYSCNLYSPGVRILVKTSYLILRNVISQVHCSTYKTTQDLEFVCTCHRGDPPITLKWIDKDGNVLAAETQQYHYSQSVIYRASIGSLYQGERFTCVATSSGSVTTQQCTGIPIMTRDKVNNTVTMASPRIAQPTEESEVNGITTFISQNIPTKLNAPKYTSTKSITSTGHETSPQYKSVSSDKDNDTVIAILSVIGAISILATVAFLCYILIKNRKKRNNTKVGEDGYMEPIRVEEDGYMEPIKVGEDVYIDPIKVGEDGYMEPIKVGEDGYMKPIKVRKNDYMEPIKVGEDGL